jgi:hypothetical protein
MQSKIKTLNPMSNLSFYIAGTALLILAVFMYPRKRKPETVADDFTYEMDNVDREALLISRIIKGADANEEKLWGVLGMIHRFEVKFQDVDKHRTYDYGKILRDEYDEQIEKLYGRSQQTA